MLFRLLAGSLIVGTLAVMSSLRQGAVVSDLPAGGMVADAMREGLVAAAGVHRLLDDGEPRHGRAAMAERMVRGVVAEQGERARRNLAATIEPSATPVASADTLKPRDRRPAWRGRAIEP
jgi:hypothetical protein